MEGLGNHRLADFILFSREVLYDVFQTYNADIWPAQLAWLALTATVLFLLLRRDDANARRAVFVIVAGAWLWVALAFHLRYFLSINWAATYFAALFVAQAALLLYVGVFSAKLGPTSDGIAFGVGATLFAASAFLPFELLGDQTWRQAVLFGWGADRTALGTIGVLLMVTGRARMLLFVAPAIWCIVTAAIYLGAR